MLLEYYTLYLHGYDGTKGFASTGRSWLIIITISPSHPSGFAVLPPFGAHFANLNLYRTPRDENDVSLGGGGRKGVKSFFDYASSS